MSLLEPTFNNGRMFISPILGCNGKCIYCYLSLKEYNVPVPNAYGISQTIECILKNPKFIRGKHGTIISIGAWGDLFPFDNNLKYHSVMWICELLKLDNPVQIMSKNKLNIDYVKEICSYVRYENQLLYSTTITTLHHYKIIEPGTDNPYERLRTCSMFQKHSIPTNIMFKPFLPSITDKNLTEIVNIIMKYKINYCVAGVLYWDNVILKRLKNNRILDKSLNSIYNVIESQGLDCNNKQLLNTYSSYLLDDFVINMKNNGINVFKKSSCVNSNLLKIYNHSNHYKNNDSFCINCGNCKLSI